MKILQTIIFVIALIAHETFASEPMSSDQQAKNMQTCFKLLRTSSEVRERFTQMNFTDDEGQDVTCVFRCGGILSRMYNDESGWNVAMVLGLGSDGNSGVEAFREAYDRCVGKIDSESYGKDYCKKSFLQFRCGMKASME